jgi:hypothetical protein
MWINNGLAQTTKFISFSSAEKKNIEDLNKRIDRLKIEIANINIIDSICSIDKIQKRLANEKLDKQTQLINNYRKIYEIYSSKIYNFWAHFEGNIDDFSIALNSSNQARDIYINALSLVDESNKVSSVISKMSLLQKACENIEISVHLIEKSLSLYISILSANNSIVNTPLSAQDTLKKQ